MGLGWKGEKRKDTKPFAKDNTQFHLITITTKCIAAHLLSPKQYNSESS